MAPPHKRARLASDGAATVPAPGPQVSRPGVLPVGVSASECCPVVEDQDTGDVLVPMSYLKPILDPNYARKLSRPRVARLVVPRQPLQAQAPDPLYWVGAFVAPQSVRAVLREHIGEEAATVGHLRLVPLPVVYNAMAERPPLRKTPLFLALTRYLRASTYWPLLRHPTAGEEGGTEGAEGQPPGDSSGRREGSGEEGMREWAEAAAAGAAAVVAVGTGLAAAPLFTGPRDFRTSLGKYIVTAPPDAAKAPAPAPAAVSTESAMEMIQTLRAEVLGALAVLQADVTALRQGVLEVVAALRDHGTIQPEHSRQALHIVSAMPHVVPSLLRPLRNSQGPEWVGGSLAVATSGPLAVGTGGEPFPGTAMGAMETSHHVPSAHHVPPAHHIAPAHRIPPAHHMLPEHHVTPSHVPPAQRYSAEVTAGLWPSPLPFLSPDHVDSWLMGEEPSRQGGGVVPPPLGTGDAGGS